jgi:hypothetical protein
VSIRPASEQKRKRVLAFTSACKLYSDLLIDIFCEVEDRLALWLFFIVARTCPSRTASSSLDGLVSFMDTKRKQ